MFLESALLLALQITGGLRVELDRLPPNEFCGQMRVYCHMLTWKSPFGSEERQEAWKWYRFWDAVEDAHSARCDPRTSVKCLEKAREAVGDDAYYYSPPTHTWGRE